MIKANGVLIKPTIFPDGTSQVWNLPSEVLDARSVDIDWRFENERELFDLFSLKELILKSNAGLNWRLYVPFLPYGRQDKEVSNDATFNLHVFAKLINMLHFYNVTTLDAHNPKLTCSLIERCRNIEPLSLHKQLLERHRNAMVVFPDAGAFHRYDKDGCEFSRHRIVFEKARDQATGKITGHRVNTQHTTPYKGEPLKEFLIFDDICDGGATFISIANQLKKMYSHQFDIYLFVTHGVFSKSLHPLHSSGIYVYTTDSLIPRDDTVSNAREIFNV